MPRYIDADALKQRIKNNWYTATEIDEDIDAEPAADVVERKVGEWEQKEDPYGFFDTIPVCSICGCTTKMRETYHYCPNCGAMMKGEYDA